MGDTAQVIYIAIRRGPMKTPTDATKVFSASNVSASAAGTAVSTGFPIDLQIFKWKSSAGDNRVLDRLRGVVSTNTSGLVSPALYTNLVNSEASNNTNSRGWDNSGFAVPSGAGFTDTIFYNFRRAPGFFDVVAYTGNGANNRQINHSLGVAPELIIVKQRSSTAFWGVYHSALGNSNYLVLNAADASAATTTLWSQFTPTSTVFEVDGVGVVNQNATTYIAYLFASCSGVSKVGSYTGTGTTLSIDCGFTSGARFVLIKRTDSTGDWYVWDTARGIVSGNDPYLLLNSTAAEVTNTDYIDPYSAGFEISSTAPAAINANGGTFIYLAIA
jgi:hypothetical protein